MGNELPLRGGRVTAGVVRVGDTVRRPSKQSSAFVGRLLALLHERGFAAAPRHLGQDEQGRDVLTFLEGEVPAELESAFSDETLAAAARIVRSYHDATAASALAAGHEVVCHNDLSPCNFVFRRGVPVAVIDFDAAAPGRRLEDVGYALFLWLDLSSEGPSAAEQARRIDVFCAAYGVPSGGPVVDAILEAVGRNADSLDGAGRAEDAAWWRAQRVWIEQHRGELLARPRNA
jgi:Ser/Thr protein kinase RdoA (MazF antagonist)